MNFSALLAAALSFFCATAFAAELPMEWIDPDTGHRIVQLSREPGSASLYFNQNAYTPDGKKLAVTTPEGISTIDLQTHEIKPVVTGKVKVLFTGHRTGRIFYLKDSAIYATQPETGQTAKIVDLPPHAGVAALNADETLFAGTTTEGNTTLKDDGKIAQKNPETGQPLTFAERKEVSLNRRLEARIPMTLFTLNAKTSVVKTLLHSTDWLNHVQFSPTDPGQIMFCHEGPWHKVDRIWIIRTDGSGLQKIHTRTMNMEIAGHEFFSADGKSIWYDLQTPRGEDFWVAGYEIAMGRRTWYHLQRNEWSVHYNVSPDGKLFAGDGGDSEMVAHAPDGKWLYLFHPQSIPDVAGIAAPGSEKLIHPGYFQAERLVNMAKHNYTLEPNVTFTPDQKWIVFRSRMRGPEQVYAVEIAKAK
jgi:oligogalacturonide lyase